MKTTKAGSNIVISATTRHRGDEDIEEGGFSGHFRNGERNISPSEATFEKLAGGEITINNVEDIDILANSLQNMLEDVPLYMCSPAHPGRISRIPENLRAVDIKSYEPCFLSIGPYHHGKPNVHHMEKKKWVILKCFLDQRPDLRLKDFLKEMQNIEPAARSFYSDVEMESRKFVEMLLLDSLYLVIVFCGMEKRHSSENTQVMERATPSNKETRSQEDYRNTPRWFWTIFMHDLLLLENQLPFFVLQKMHELVFGGSGTQLLVIIKSIFHYLLLDYVKLDTETVISPSAEFHHLLHLCHLYFRPILQHDSTTSQFSESSQLFRLGSAVQLYEAGVRFKAKSSSKSSTHSLLDITFNDSGKLVMPTLHVDDNTNSLLRNLIALEQMKFPSLGLDVSGYAVLLLHLITIPDDVKLLRRKGIIQHHLASDKEMMYLVNRLSVGLSFDYGEDNYSLKPVFQELKRYTDHRVPRWRAWLKHNYFTNPWMAISLLAASFLLLLTIVQTYYSVYSYYHPYFNGQS